MAYNSKGAATTYSAFNRGNNDNTQDSTPSNALQDSSDSSKTTPANANDLATARKKALKKRLLSMRGN